MKTWIATSIVFLFAVALASPAAARTCANGKSSTGAMWLSILHAGVGEWSLNGWGNFKRNAPQRKFWLGWIPGYGIGYLSVVSAIDAANCRTDDDLTL